MSPEVIRVVQNAKLMDTMCHSLKANVTANVSASQSIFTIYNNTAIFKKVGLKQSNFAVSTCPNTLCIWTLHMHAQGQMLPFKIPLIYS